MTFRKLKMRHVIFHQPVSCFIRGKDSHVVAFGGRKHNRKQRKELVVEINSFGMTAESCGKPIDLQPCKDKPDMSFTNLLEEAFAEKEVGEIDRYNFILKCLADDKFDDERLIKFIEAARSCLSLLKGENETLVGAILKIKWTGRGEELVKCYINFLVELVSAHTFYLRGCLRMLLQNFLPPLKFIDKMENFDLKQFDKQFNNTHEGIFAIMRIVPTAPRHLLIKLGDFFPYIGKSQILIQLYVKNMFYITKYMPSLQEKIFEIIIDNLLKIDVQICKHELEDEMSDTDDEADDVQFDVEIESEHKEEQKPCGDEMKHETARKLDNLMLTVFEHIYEMCFNNGRTNWEEAENLYADLIRVFEMVLLPTHASSYVQFVVFYICSFDQYFANSFLEFCWQKVCDPNVPVILRQTASAYIGSFVARANFLKLDIVKTCLELLSDWIHSYLNVLDSCVYPDLSKHAAFYSVCQTLFYVFVFRFRYIEEMHNWRDFLKKLNLDRIVTCRLNPLKFCAQTVVDMFARVTRKYEIVFCYTIIEHNRRSLLPSTVSGGLKDKKNMLDSFFPFDPYLLKKSSKFIEPIYQQWIGIDGDDSYTEGDGNGNKDSFDETKLDDMKIQLSVSPGTPRFDICISPGFHPELVKRHVTSEE